MKKKLTVAFILEMVLGMLFITIAFATTHNLFEKYGQTYPRFLVIAPQTNITPVVSTIENDSMGESTVSIANGYYDGSTLAFGYTIENPEFIDYFTPTREQMAQMKPGACEFKLNQANEKEVMLEEEYNKARLNGSAFGVMKFNVYLSADTYSDRGINLGTWTEFNEYSEQNLYSFIREYDSLPQVTRNLESLTISIPIYQNQCFFYYDGESEYFMETQTEIKPVVFTIKLAQIKVHHYDGENVYNESSMHCVVEATSVNLSARISSQEKLPELPDGYYYDMCLSTADGSLIEASSSEIYNDNSIAFAFHGTGIEPDIQTARLLIVGGKLGTTVVDFALMETE